MNKFFQGMAQAFDLFGALGPRRPKPLTPKQALQADMAAMERDWQTIGYDFGKILPSLSPPEDFKDEWHYADLNKSDLESMRDMIAFYSESGTRRERRLVKALSKALTWIEREAWLNEQAKITSVIISPKEDE